MTQVESIEFFTFTATRREVQKGEKKKKSVKIFIIRTDLKMRQPQNIVIIPSPVIYQLFHLEVHVFVSGYMYIS